MSKRDSGRERKPRDDYGTPPGPIDALLGVVNLPPVLWEPAPGEGRMVDHLRERGFEVISGGVTDFLDKETTLPDERIGAIVTNPPYVAAAEFARQALWLLTSARPPQKLVLLLPSDFDHAATRRDLFGSCPAFVGQVKLTKRIVWFERTDGKRAAPSENHSWFVWSWLHDGDPWVRYAAW